MTTYLTAGFCVAFLTSLLITPLVKRLSPVLGLIDLPGLRKVHVVPTPRGGGIAIFLGCGCLLLAGLGGIVSVAGEGTF